MTQKHCNISLLILCFSGCIGCNIHLDKVASQPTIQRELTEDEFESLDPKVRQLWLVVRDGSVLGTKTEEIATLLRAATAVQKHKNGGALYMFSIDRSQLPIEGTLTLFIEEGQSGVVISCGLSTICK